MTISNDVSGQIQPSPVLEEGAGGISLAMDMILSKTITVFQNEGSVSPYDGLQGRVKHRLNLKQPSKKDPKVLHQKLSSPIPNKEAPRKIGMLDREDEVARWRGALYDDKSICKIAGNTVYAASSSGPNEYMEDRHVSLMIKLVDPNESREIEIPVFGVFDGHAGAQCSKFLKKNFVKILADKLSMIDQTNENQMVDAIRAAFLEANALFNNKTKKRILGSTAIISFIVDNTLWVANAGDCRAVLSRNETAIQLSQDAVGTDQPFKKSLEKRGMTGRYFWFDPLTKSIKNSITYPKKEETKGEPVFPKCVFMIRPKQQVIGPARALGNKGLRGISPLPKIKAFDLNTLESGENNFLILASDGFWDVIGTEEAVGIMNKVIASNEGDEAICEKIAKKLRDEAFRYMSRDNVTVMIVDLNQNNRDSV